jgi:carbamoyl-phosphate synthase small subunit
VIDRRSGVVEVTSQNHGFMVDAASLAQADFELTHFSGNDGTLEGMVHRTLPVLSCQYHPEAGPGPHDSRPWFDAFRDRVLKPRLARRRPAATPRVPSGVRS